MAHRLNFCMAIIYSCTRLLILYFRSRLTVLTLIFQINCSVNRVIRTTRWSCAMPRYWRQRYCLLVILCFKFNSPRLQLAAESYGNVDRSTHWQNWTVNGKFLKFPFMFTWNQRGLFTIVISSFPVSDQRVPQSPSFCSVKAAIPHWLLFTHLRNTKYLSDCMGEASTAINHRYLYCFCGLDYTSSFWHDIIHRLNS